MTFANVLCDTGTQLEIFLEHLQGVGGPYCDLTRFSSLSLNIKAVTHRSIESGTTCTPLTRKCLLHNWWCLAR